MKISTRLNFTQKEGLSIFRDMQAYAGRQVTYAIKKGRITRQPCEICGVKKTHAHHEDYFEPLKVKWLCPKHHSARHKEIRSGKILLWEGLRRYELTDVMY